MSKSKVKAKKSSSASPKGQTGFRGGISEIMKQAHRTRTKLEELKEQMKDDEWIAEAAGGKIKATINGQKEITQLEIAEELVDPKEIQILQDSIISAVNAAITLADEKLNSATEEVTKGMKIPGLF